MIKEILTEVLSLVSLMVFGATLLIWAVIIAELTR